MKYIVLFVLSVLCSMHVFSEGNSAEQEFKQKLEKISSNNKTIRCDFVQTKKVKNIRQAVRRQGKFFYENSGHMALVYNEPKGDKIIMNGSDFFLMVSGKKISSNADSNPMMAQISYMMQACMSGDISKLGRGWQMNIAKNNEGYSVKLSPVDRRIQKFITDMVMNFDRNDLTLNTLRIDEKSGGYTEYSFTNKELNTNLDSSVFKMKE